MFTICLCFHSHFDFTSCGKYLYPSCIPEHGVCHTLSYKNVAGLSSKLQFPFLPPVKLMANSPLPFVWIPACPHLQAPGTSALTVQPHSSFLNYMGSKAFNI